MKILITNDDGIQAPGLYVLANWAKKYGEVTVIAPKSEQSAKSQSINIHTPFEIVPVQFANGIEAYSVDSTPADCVRFAAISLNRDYDLVLSGINRGLNIGLDILYSATVGAIYEASITYPHVCAVSTESRSLDFASTRLDEVYDYFVKNKLFDYWGTYNVNIPSQDRGIHITHQGGRYYNDKFVDLGNGMFCQHGYSVHEDHGDYTVDTDAALNGYISISPLTVDRTRYDVYNKLNELLNK
ncbi:MAG: 5'/3'-nucleotidase SurE [Clostridia bacterium]|nr:5'/3'-nucleotidase SurE [Clostridia bacterium]